MPEAKVKGSPKTIVYSLFPYSSAGPGFPIEDPFPVLILNISSRGGSHLMYSVVLVVVLEDLQAHAKNIKQL